MLVFFSIAAFQFLRAQPSDLQFEHITTIDGLSQDIVTCLHRDKFGFMWIGTEDGLNLYDGYAIRIYKHIPGDTATLPSNWILGICEFGEEDLLIATSRGICVFRRASDRFAPAPGVLRGLPPQACHKPARDSEGNYWIIQNPYRVIRCSSDLTGISEFDTRRSSDSSPVNAFLRDRMGRIVLGTESGLQFLDRKFAILKSIPVRDPDLPAPKQIPVVSLAEGDSGELWVGTRTGLYRYDERRETFRYIPLFGKVTGSNEGRDQVLTLEWDRSRRLWVGGFGGLYCYDPRERHTTRYSSVGAGRTAPQGSRIYAIYADPSEILWVGTWREGLGKANLHTERFGLLRHTAATPFAGGESAISAIYESPDGTLWLGSQGGGMTLVDPTRKAFRHWAPGLLSGTTITAITGDMDGNVWIASNYNMLDWYEMGSRRMRHLRLSPSPGGQKSIFSMKADPGGHLWIGTEAHGMYRLDTRRGIFETYGPASEDSVYRRIRSAWALHSDRDGNLWIGGWLFNTDLHRLAAHGGGLRSYSQPELSSARAIIDDEEGGIWVATWGNGLTKFNPSSGLLRNFTDRDGLPSSYVKGILRDDHGNLWISTENGLSNFNPRTGMFRNYDISDGLQGNFFYSGACFKGRDGKLYFGGTGGVNAFYPDSIRDPEYVAPVLLTAFRVFDQRKFFQQSFSLVHQVELSYGENLFAFEYTALDYRSPARNRYSYIMEGFDHDWINAGTRRYVSYTHLDPGTYAFKVKGTNSDGVWNPIPASIVVVIAPAFWQTWWFRAGAALAIASLLYGIYRYRVYHLLAVERTRSAIATDLHDDIGASLTGIALSSDLARRDIAAGSPDAGGRLEQISQTSRSLLDAMNDIVWSIKPENDALEQTILRMEDYAVRLLEENGIDLHVQIPDDLRTVKLPMTARRNLFLIFKEAIGNILKHSGATRVEVTISSGESGRRRSDLQVSIGDNGKGFDPSEPRAGNGLGNMDLRARLLMGTFNVTSAPHGGTTLVVRFPIKSPK
jgi:ligand-binding sensor domain-containing protein/two-component sensor histidine kinase